MKVQHKMPSPSYQINTNEGGNNKFVANLSRVVSNTSISPDLKQRSCDSTSQGKTYIYHIVDTRNDNAIAGKSTMDFDMPSIKAGGVVLDSSGVEHKGTLGYYLNKSIPGNMFTGVVNVKTGKIDIYPLLTERYDMIDSSWGQKEFKGVTHDSGECIKHPGQGSKEAVSHLQLLSKLQVKDNDDYIGFTLLDVRGLRRNIADLKNDDVSMIYGASRILNVNHINLLKDDSTATSMESNLETCKKNPGTFTYHLPIEVKRNILEGIKNELGEVSSWNDSIKKELLRDELNIASYDSHIKSKSKPKEFGF